MGSIPSLNPARAFNFFHMSFGVKEMFKSTALIIAATLALGACSTRSLDPAPITSGDATQAGAGGAGAGGVGTNTVTGVDAGQAGNAQAGPQGVSGVVYFDFDSFVVRSSDRQVVEAHARYLQADRNRRVVLEGHTDERGGREYNLALGQKRAEAVRNSLNLLGVSDAQIEATSYGEEKPAVSGSNESAYAQNRRVEFKYQ